MKRLLFLPFAAVLLPSALCAQSADAAIERTLLAAPESLRAEATILELRPDGSTAVLRGGSNGLICWDNEGRPCRSRLCREFGQLVLPWSGFRLHPFANAINRLQHVATMGGHVLIA